MNRPMLKIIVLYKKIILLTTCIKITSKMYNQKLPIPWALKMQGNTNKIQYNNNDITQTKKITNKINKSEKIKIDFKNKKNRR
jgi:hypothetical protein